MDALTVARARAQTQLDEAWRMAEAAGHQEGTPEWERAVDREMDRLREYEVAAVPLRQRWEVASDASPDHPYLKRKGVTSAPGLKQDGDTLLVPMKGLEKGAPLMNLQTIRPDGKKLFGKGGRAGRTRTTIGQEAFKPSGTLYIVEGWVTGWTVHHVTGDAVVVAFSAGNLHHVAVAMREKYPKATIIIAADNDRWSGTTNPGVTQAREAAAAAQALVAIPDFRAIDGRPTDFNDLFLAEGADAVRLWLDPERASEAATSAPVAMAVSSTNGTPLPAPIVDQGPELEPPPDEDEDDDEEPASPPRPVTWQDRAPFRCLGYDHGNYYYLPRGTGQITGLTAAQHDRKTLLPLAPLSWWEQEFPARHGVSWGAAADAMLRSSERAGVFRPERIRGRGCWPERVVGGGRGILIHLGDRLLPPDAKRFVDPEKYRSPTRFVYERQHRLAGPSMDPLELREAEAVLDVFQSFNWLAPSSAALAAGWTVLAPVGGALTWRPHVWWTGERGCGKSSGLTRLVVPLLGDMVLEVQGGTTEAGVRQELRADALPVVFDEAEEDETAGRRIQSVLALARQASSESGARTLKGTIGGSALQFRVRSMFCLASIGGAVHTEADRSRISLLQLRGASQVGRDERHEHWRQLAPKLDTISPELGERLIARTLRLLRSGMLPESVKVFRHAAAMVLGEARTGDQYGTLYAGAWTLMSDEPPSEEEAREIISAEDLTTYQADHVPEGKKALGALLQQIERLDTPNGPRTLAVGQLVDIACGRAGEVSSEIADARLRQIGIRVSREDETDVIYLANSSEWMKHALRDTIYSRGIRTVLLTLPGVTPGDQVRFHPGLKSRTLRVPYSLLE